MDRRVFVLAAPALLSTRPVQAHHGWGSFDQDRPLYLEGVVSNVRWRNPHVELAITLPAELRLPADLRARAVPAQTAPVEGQALLARASLPARRDRQWEVELAPLTRMQAWKIEPLVNGQRIAVVGFTFKDEQGAAILRAEYLFVGAAIYGLRSSPA
jgi:hypothetical protein